MRPLCSVMCVRVVILVGCVRGGGMDLWYGVRLLCGSLKSRLAEIQLLGDIGALRCWSTTVTEPCKGTPGVKNARSVSPVVWYRCGSVLLPHSLGCGDRGGTSKTGYVISLQDLLNFITNQVLLGRTSSSSAGISFSGQNILIWTYVGVYLYFVWLFFKLIHYLRNLYKKSVTSYHIFGAKG